MSKKHFIALADHIRIQNAMIDADDIRAFNENHIESLADFCAAQNPNFKRDRWLAYIKGECGQNGGQK